MKFLKIVACGLWCLQFNAVSAAEDGTDDSVNTSKSRFSTVYTKTLKQLNDVTFNKLSPDWKYRSDDILCNVRSVFNDISQFVWNAYTPRVNETYKFFPITRIKINHAWVFIPAMRILNNTPGNIGAYNQSARQDANIIPYKRFSQLEPSMSLWRVNQVNNMLATARYAQVARIIKEQSGSTNMRADQLAFNQSVSQLQRLCASSDTRISSLALQMLAPVAADSWKKIKQRIFCNS